jgi:hypothetical protein
MNSPNPLSRPDPQAEGSLEANIDENALMASGSQPKHGAAVAALSGPAADSAALDAVEPDAGSQGITV